VRGQLNLSVRPERGADPPRRARIEGVSKLIEQALDSPHLVNTLY
jgi:hypothetical protein